MEDAERHLWEQYERTRSDKDRNVLVLFHMKCVFMNSTVFYRKLSTYVQQRITFDEITAAASLGLIQAVEKFDLSRNLKFITYSAQRIRGAIIDWMRSIDHIPRNHRIAIKRGAEPDVRKLSIDSVRTVSSDEGERVTTLEEVDGALPQDLQHLPEFWFWDEEAVREITGWVFGDARTVVELYYLSPLTMKQIGKRLGLSESRVSQIHTKALRKIRQRYERTFLDEEEDEERV